MQYQNVYSYILGEEQTFRTAPITVYEGYEWSFYEHVRRTILYKNSTYAGYRSGRGYSNRDLNKPFFNIILPILNLQYRATGFDVKDIELYVDEVKSYFKSFLVRKFHDRWAREEEIDTFIDECIESYVDFGGSLIKQLPKEPKPEVVPLQRIAFCDQTKLLGGAICEKHFFLPDELKDMEKKGWEHIDEIIELAQPYKEETYNRYKRVDTPTKYIEVYELHGILPENWLKDGEDKKVTDYVRQMQIVAFYKTKKEKKGITLFRGKETKPIYDAVIRDPIFGRALGRGGAEELFQPQVWVNYSVLRMKGMLDAASKVIYQTADKTFHAQNNLERVDNNEILIHDAGKPLTQINTFTPNVRLFESSLAQWNAQAKTIGSATEGISGEQPKSGTPFASLELTTAEAHSLHEYRKGKIATAFDRIWRNWIIPFIGKEIIKGQEFLAELDLDELEEVTEKIVINQANKMVKERILKGQLVSQPEVDAFKEKVREEFKKGGTKRFLKILKGEFKDLPFSVKINIVGKQAYLPQTTEKLVNVFRQIVANPAILQNKGAAKLFNQILESSGLSPLDFTDFTKPQTVQPQLQAAPQPQAAQITAPLPR